MARIAGYALLVLLGSGCLRDQAARRHAFEVERQVETMRRQADRDRQAMRDLENRLFLVEDKVDTAEVSRAKSPDVMPRLPVVKKGPAEPDAAEPMTQPAPDLPPLRYDEFARGEPEPRPMPRRAPVVISDPEERGYPRVADPGADRITVSGKPAPIRKEDAVAMYRAAYEALARREHALAITGFRTFLSRFPAHDNADNAQYWLGEAFYDQGDFRSALTEFGRVVERYPGGNKAPDALLKVGFCHARLGDPAAARDALAQVRQIYPRTDAARLAEKRLGEDDKEIR